MKSTIWRRTTQLTTGSVLCRGALASIALLAPASVRAAVVGVGDIVPFITITDEEGDEFDVPDLPTFGGEVTGNNGDVIVGGTGENVGGTATGEVAIGIPASTDPLESNSLTIGGNIYGLGLVQLAGLNSEWLVDTQIIVGQEGQGFLELATGSRVTSDVAGSGLQSPSPDNLLAWDLVFGQFEGSQGFAVVDGFASLLLSTNASIGHRSQGRIDLTNRARMVTTSEASIGTDLEVNDNAVGTGHVLVDGQGTRWVVGLVETSNNTSPPDNFNGLLVVGNRGRGTLEIRNQGWVSVETDVIMGEEAGSRGEISVTGQNSQLWALEDLYIGGGESGNIASEGELTIAEYGIARADGITNVGELGYVEFRGGTLLTPIVNNSGVMRGYGRVAANVLNEGDIRNAAALANQRERLVFSGTVENTSGSIIESIGGEMEFEDDVTNSGQIFAKNAILRFRGTNGLIDASGDFYTEDSVIETPLGVPLSTAMTVGAGVSNVIGDVNLTGMSITVGDDFSQLFVTGGATLGGPLSITLDSGYIPAAGDSFEILAADGGYTGTFGFVSSPAGYTFAVDYTDPESVFVTYAGIAPPGMGADFNGDGVVDGADMAIWSQNFGLGANPPPAATQAQGDANGDGVVNGFDFLLIQQKFGGPPAVAVAGAVPEPSTLLLVAAALLPLGAVRRRK